MTRVSSYNALSNATCRAGGRAPAGPGFKVGDSDPLPRLNPLPRPRIRASFLRAIILESTLVLVDWIISPLKSQNPLNCSKQSLGFYPGAQFNLISLSWNMVKKIRFSHCISLSCECNFLKNLLFESSNTRKLSLYTG